MEKLKIMLDTDMGSDCDDAGALALLHCMSKKKNADIVSVTHCASEICGAVAVKAINEYFGKSDIPVGRYTAKPFLEEDICKAYTKIITKDYLKTHNMPEFESAVRVMRRVLAKDSGITIITIGILNNIAELICSQADDISPLTGLELIQKSVKNMYVMGGNFKDTSEAEYNIKCDIKSAQLVAKKFPAPIIYCGFELGDKVITGECFKKTDNLIKTIYYLHNKDGIRQSWDPITVFCALEPDSDLFVKSKKMTITFNDDGTAKCRPNGKDCYMIMNKTVDDVTYMLETNMFTAIK